MSDFTIVVPIHNEQSRLQKFLKEIPTDIPVLLLDKSSTDDSLIIANKFSNVDILNIPFGPPSSEMDHLQTIKDKIGTEWCMILVVSQTLDLSLYRKITKVIHTETYDVIELPFINYTFNLCESYNPWPSRTHKRLLARVSVLDLQPRVHHELKFSSDRVKKISPDFGSIHHHSNLNLESFLTKSLSYARQEALEYQKLGEMHIALSSPVKFVFKSLINGYFRRNFTLFRGRRGVLLGSAYVLTQLLILLFVIYESENNDIA